MSQPSTLGSIYGRKPRVLAVLPALIPSTLIGVVKPLVSLHQSGRVVARISFEGWVRRREVEETDLVIFCRNLEPHFAWVLDLALSRGKPIIYVLDDDLFDVPSDSEVALYHRDPSRLAQLEKYVASASLVCVYSNALARRLREINPNVDVVAGSVDFGLLRPLRHKTRSGPVKIVFATSRSKDTLADVFVEELLRLLNDFRGQAEAYFWGCRPPKLAGQPYTHFVDFVPGYDRFLKRFSRSGYDIGLAPLLDDDFHRSKTNNKYREYGACRIAGIYSDVDVYSSCVEHGVTGLIVPNTPGAWHDATVRLIEDEPLRESIRD